MACAQGHAVHPWRARRSTSTKAGMPNSSVGMPSGISWWSACAPGHRHTAEKSPPGGADRQQPGSCRARPVTAPDVESTAPPSRSCRPATQSAPRPACHGQSPIAQRAHRHARLRASSSPMLSASSPRPHRRHAPAWPTASAGPAAPGRPDWPWPGCPSASKQSPAAGCTGRPGIC